MDNGHSNARILVVDDIPDTLELIINWLELHSYETIQATSGPEALKLAAEEKPDLILLDVMMPKMDGIETCRQLKANTRTAAIPVILVTAKDPSDTRADGMLAGAVDYIAKPVNLPDLVNKVESALATDENAPPNTQRLLDEVAHTTLAIMGSAMVWLLALDQSRDVLVSQSLVTSSGSAQESNFLARLQKSPTGAEFPVDDPSNPLCNALRTRQTMLNLPIQQLQDPPSTGPLFESFKQLRLSYITIVPLSAVGKPVGVMLLGNYQPQDMESPRAQQILTACSSQAAIAVDYNRLMEDAEKREEERRSEQSFRQMIIDTMSDALVVIDSRGNIKYMNRRLLRMSNYTQAELEGQSAGLLFHPNDRHDVMTGLLQENAATMKFDQRLVTSDGRVIPVLMSRSRSQSNQLDNQVVVLSDMTEQKNREIALERQSSRLTALIKAVQVIASNLSLHETLQDILDSAIQMVEAQGASLFMVNRENEDELFVVAAAGHKAADMINLRIPIGEGIAGWVAREARPALVSELQDDERFYRAVDEMTGIITQSVIAVPLIHGEDVIGVIEVVNKLDGAFDASDLQMLETMAGTAAVSIVNARLFDQSQRRVAELATLLNTSEAASSTLNLANVLDETVHSLISSLDVEHCILMAWDSGKNRLETLSEISDVFWEEGSGPAWQLSEGSITYRALTQETPVVISKRDANISLEDRNRLHQNGMLHMMALPISLHGELSGVAILYSSASPGFTEEHIRGADTIIKNWQDKLTATYNLLEVSDPVISDLTQQLSKIDSTCWVSIQYWRHGDYYTRTVREFGFAEWTNRHGPRLALVDHPNMQEVVTEKRSMVITSDMLNADSHEYRWLQYRGGSSALMIPLISHAAAIGMVVLIDVNLRHYEDQEVNLAQGIANVVSNAMENARLFQSLQSRAKALESAYRELQEADKTKDHFIQNVSHELRTPLIHVVGYSELLVDEAFGPLANDEQRDALKTVAQKAAQVANIVEEMVSVQAQETSVVDRQPINIVELIENFLSQASTQIHESHLQISTHFPEAIPPVLADPNLITDAFEKLFRNALKFGSEGEHIEVLVKDTDGPVIQVAIRDYGIGVDPSEQEKIFQRFYQVDGGVNRRFGGTGMGLAVAKSIIESHGGRIGVRSRLGEGSIFYFTLPKADYISN
ncbi:MAG: GAF domain-containing protein [Anaerolineae bacterium]|nr:GAF domain-containing protein [Anaerolineae bacterium]